MFKFRNKPAGICSSVSPELDILSDSVDALDDDSSASGSSKHVEQEKAVQGDSVSESRFSVLPKDDPSERNSVVSTITPVSGIIEQDTSSSSLSPHHLRGSACSSTGSLQLSESNGSLHGKTMLDRKRKERHESTSQGQEKKVIRSVSDDESLNDSDRNGDFRRTLSHDSFNSKKHENNNLPHHQLLGYAVEMRKPIEQDLVEIVKQPQNTDKSEANQAQTPDSSHTNNMGNFIMTCAEPQFDVMRKIVVSENYEPELQRQLERSANWSSTPPTTKSRGHKRRGRSSRRGDHYGKQLLEVEVDVDVSNGTDFTEEAELHSPASESSSTESVENEMVGQNGVPTVEIDEVEDVTSQTSERLMALGFSNAQQQLEHTNVTSIRAALGGTSADDEVMLSPRNSVLGKEGIDIPYNLHQAPMDPPISRQGYLDGNPVTKMNELSRQITALKRQLKNLELEYQQVYGYRPSHSDKLNSKEMRKCVLQLTKAKKELKQIREDPSCLHVTSFSGVTSNILSVNRGNSIPPTKGTPEYAKYLEASVREIEKTLVDKRRVASRPDDLEKMSALELQDEKCLMQRQLLVLEKRHGRPSSKQEKDIVRPLYDRYRAIKRCSVKVVCVREAALDLAPIMEGETLEFSDETQETPAPRATVASDVWMAGDREQLAVGSDADVGEAERNESYNEMTLNELETRLRQAKDEKRRMRAAIRKFEAEFQNVAGRPPQKDEKYSSTEMELAYQKYKRIKATVRLLDVLISKRRVPTLIQDYNKNED